MKSKKEKAERINLSYYDENRHDRTKRYFGNTFEKLQNSTVLVVGAGAVGNEVVKNLVMLGIKNIKLVDFDTVNKSNVNRCIFFREEDHNKMKKVDAVKRRVLEINPEVNIETFNCKIQEAPEEVWEVDLVIIGVDNDYARYFINAWLVSAQKKLPVINGAMAKDLIECETVIPGETACLVCLWSENYFQEVINTEVKKNCDEFFIEILPKFPAISTFSSILGGIMVSEAVKLLTGKIKLGGVGYLVRFNLNTYEVTKGNIMRNPRCVEQMCRSGYKVYREKFAKK